VVSVRSPEDVIVTPRILSFLADAFGRWGINCVEMTSVYTDTHFALQSSDAVRAFEILSDLAQTTSDARAEPAASEDILPGADRRAVPPPARRSAPASARPRSRAARR
jgi:hypothetical protein